MYSIVQPQLKTPYIGMMQNPTEQQSRPYQGILQVPFQGQHLQTQPFQPLQGYPGVSQQGYTYVGHQNPPYSNA